MLVTCRCLLLFCIDGNQAGGALEKRRIEIGTLCVDAQSQYVCSLPIDLKP